MNIRCPKCKRNKLLLNTHGYSRPYYQCNDQGMTGKNCNFEMPVSEFEVRYQGEMSKVDRIRNKLSIGLMERNDFEYLLNEVERLSNELKKIADMEVLKSAESAFTQDMQEIACNAVGYV